MTSPLSATLFSDPACPFGYSENPALRVIEWRYGSQIDWRLVLVGLSEDTSRYESHGYTPAAAGAGRRQIPRAARGCRSRSTPKSRLAASSRACRAVIAARREWPGSEWAVFRTLQLANFNTPLLFDDDDQLREVLSVVDGDRRRPHRLADRLARGAGRVRARQGRDAHRRRLADRAPGQGRQQRRRTSATPRRRWCSRAPPTVCGSRPAACRPVEAYDVLVANLDPTLERKAPPEDPAELLEHFQFGLTTQEVAALLTVSNDLPDRAGAERALLGARGRGPRRAPRARRRCAVDGARRPASAGASARSGAAGCLSRRSRTACRTAARRPAGSR